jgi:ribonuclease PH
LNSSGGNFYESIINARKERNPSPETINIMPTSTGRLDGRTSNNTLRPLSCEVVTLTNADGSCLWKSGKTHILAAVYGPIAPNIVQKEQSNQAQVSVILKGDGASDEDIENLHELSCFLQTVLKNAIDVKKFPRCIVQITLQIVQSDGSLLGCLLHSSVMSLMTAGVDLLYTPVGTTCLVEENNGKNPTILLDPTAQEERADRDSSLLVMVCNANNVDKLLACHTVGPGIDIDTILKCQKIASKATPAISAFWRLVLEQKVTREAQTLWSR